MDCCCKYNCGCYSHNNPKGHAYFPATTMEYIELKKLLERIIELLEAK